MDVLAPKFNLGESERRGEEADVADDSGEFGWLQTMARRLGPPVMKELARRTSLQIDWKFISEREGGQRLEGYVPKAGSSGVTIATGFDIGARNKRDLERLELSIDLVEKLLPYCGRQRPDADKYLKEHPLKITNTEAGAIDRAVKKSALNSLVESYNRDSPETQFDELPSAAQTVIASVWFQYGSLNKKTSSFWRFVTKQQWKEAVDDLQDFHDNYPTRRKIEAALLESIVSKQADNPSE
ncbi:pesticin C-terminus-like muramidase [Sorangium sp. So ce291]|uniref:pesticin C-terminus-like muramidase n=1 Tax=Sorangium sp. So ce291 TaxID=3133294 RepID=UPI003F616779